MTIKIGVWGASTTYGAKDKELGGWVNRLRLYLENKNKNVLIDNCGVSGALTFHLLERFEIEARARRPHIILFSLGANDCAIYGKKESSEVNIKNYEKNVRDLITLGRRFTDKIIFIEQFHVNETKTNPVSWGEICYKNELIKKYNSKIKEICEQDKLIFVPLFNLLKNNDLEDGLHPNEKGHEKIFKKVLPIVKKTIGK